MLLQMASNFLPRSIYTYCQKWSADSEVIGLEAAEN